LNGARYSYLRRICDLVEQGQDIVIVSEDYAAPIFDDFRKRYPTRFLSVGIAEQNGMAVACGLALAGKYPIVYGCAPFPLTRAVDQLKSAAAVMHLPMTLLNSGIGFGVPEFGATHYNIDDIAIVRGIPGVRIVTPTDNIMAEHLADFSLSYKGPLYIRFDKNSEGVLYQPKEIDFLKGFHTVRTPEKKTDIVIVSCGFMIQEMLEIAEKMAGEGIHIKVIDLYSLPFDVPALLDEIGSLPIVSVEEHITQGGIGSAVLEALNTCQRKNAIVRLGVEFAGSYPNIFGSREYFMKQYGLSEENIALAVRTLYNRQVKT